MKILSSIMMTLTLVMVARGSGVGKAWDVSPSQQPNSHRLSWPRLDTSPLEIRTISGVGRLPQQFKANFRTNNEPKNLNLDDRRQSRRKEIVEDDIEFETRQKGLRPILNSLDFSKFEEILPRDDKIKFDSFTETERVRRDTEPKMEKIAGTKNVREARLSSPESWSKQPISIEFRHRTPLDEIAPAEQDIPISSRRSHMAQTDFITSNRRIYPENRDPRGMPVARSYDDYDVPIYHSPPREYDVPVPRGYRYPNRYRTERDYRYRKNSMPSHPYDQYPANNFESYERNRPTKPKRIIYYATLPDIVRKPEWGNYPRPYDSPSRVPPVVPVSRNSAPVQKNVQNTLEPNRRPYYRYPYDNYDYEGYNYKRPGFYDRPDPYYEESGRRNSQNRDLVPAHKENLRRAEDSNDSIQERKTRDNQDLPWPVQVGAEVSVKENERIPGRKIFGQLESHDRYESARMKKASNESGDAVEHSN